LLMRNSAAPTRRMSSRRSHPLSASCMRLSGAVSSELRTGGYQSGTNLCGKLRILVVVRFA
jgi:hypothetical protein